MKKSSLIVVCALVGLAPVAASAQVSPAVQRATVAVSTPAASSVVSGTVWLTLPGQAALEQAVAAMYNPASPSYHQFLTWQTLTPYLPTAAQLSAVKAELAANHLTVTATDAHNLNLQFTGSAESFEAAFHTGIEQHAMVNGTQIRVFTATPSLGSVAGLVRAVTGVGHAPEQPDIAQPVDPRTGKLLGVQTLQQAAAQATAGYPGDCLFSPAPVALTTPGQLSPDAVYYGLIYGAPLSGGQLSPAGRCGFTPAQFDAQAGLNPVHSAGYTGSGQSIAILEEVGSPTLTADVAAFDALYNLPAANLNIVNLTTGTEPDNAFVETTLDVESAHVVAPGASLVVVDTDGNGLQGGLLYVLEHNLANVVSMSYGSTELEDDADYISTWNEEAMLASSMHVSFDVSAGDYGDQIADEGSPDVNVPADSPYVTGVGGLSIAYVPGTNTLYKTSWGLDMTRIDTYGKVNVPPVPIPHGATKFGGGGGLSTIFPLPAYQAALGGTWRHVPDVSDLANGYTGLNIVVTDPANCTTSPCVEVAGGTSLAAPIFSAKWALLDQLFGAPLGQAAPLIARFAGSPAVEDIVPLPGFGVVGANYSSSGFQLVSANTLASPETSQPYLSALWQGIEGEDDYVLTLNTDSTLAVTPGYDFATGWGQLNVAAIFAAAAAPAQAR